MKCNVLDFIPEGEENAISARELSQLLHCHRRKITLAINYLRCNGEVICSNTHRAIDTATLSIDTIPHGGLKITDKTAQKIYIVRRVGHG